jgi:UDP-N-acetylmuramoyl-tripeptide--D-alanyl-D-alanine ligase
VRSVSLEQVADATGGTLTGEWAKVNVTSVGTDTRDLTGKDLFVALAGPNFDANGFLDDALKAGARAAVVSARSPLARDFHERNPAFPLVFVKNTERALGDLAAFVRRGLDLTVIGITGTTGKTCTKDYVASIMSVEKSTISTPGSYNNEVGIPLTIFEARKKDRRSEERRVGKECTG